MQLNKGSHRSPLEDTDHLSDICSKYVLDKIRTYIGPSESLQDEPLTIIYLLNNLLVHTEVLYIVDNLYISIDN